MENKENYLEFVSSDNYKHQIDIWYRTYSISREKIELFYDFLISVYTMVDKTYMGPEVTITDEDKKIHYTWCWDKTIENFKKERIYFKERGSAYEYFWKFYDDAFYMSQDDKLPIRIDNYFYRLFDFKHRKSRSELDVLSEIYKLLEQNLKK